jgi:1-acyl-sn-glycerol-3-phosphate acyltransferase
MDQLVRPAVRLLVGPEVHGLDRVAAVEGPVIFVANHHSHLDTPVLLSSLPERWRHRAVVAAAADYFFDTRVKGALSALVLGALPVERSKVDRRPIEQSLSLLEDGWSLVIFPEGGRSPDGWGQPFRGGAAFLGLRSGLPVVPVHIEGTGRVLPKGAKRPARADVHITFGSPLRARADESAHRFSDRIEAAVAALGDERATDWWSARRRAAAGATPALTGPDEVGSWRRSWALDRNRRAGRARRWP